MPNVPNPLPPGWSLRSPLGRLSPLKGDSLAAHLWLSRLA